MTLVLRSGLSVRKSSRMRSADSACGRPGSGSTRSGRRTARSTGRCGSSMLDGGATAENGTASSSGARWTPDGSCSLLDGPLAPGDAWSLRMEILIDEWPNFVRWTHAQPNLWVKGAGPRSTAGSASKSRSRLSARTAFTMNLLPALDGCQSSDQKDPVHGSIHRVSAHRRDARRARPQGDRPESTLHHQSGSASCTSVATGSREAKAPSSPASKDRTAAPAAVAVISGWASSHPRGA
jgi:hypothetical protein